MSLNLMNDMITTFKKKRPNNERTKLWLAIAATIMSVFTMRKDHWKYCTILLVPIVKINF